MSSPHVVPNIGPVAVSFPFSFLPAFLQALTLALANFSNAGKGAVSDGGREETTEAKVAATGSLPSRRLRFACVKPRISTGSFYIIFIRPSCSVLSTRARCSRDDFSCT